MAEPAQDPRQLYKDILLPAGQGINARPDVNLDAAKMRDAFNRAAKGQDVVDTAFINGLTGGQTNLYRSNPSDTTRYDFKKDIEPAMRLAQIKAQRPLTADETRQFDESITKMAASTGLKENLIRSQLPELEKAFKEEDKKLFNQFAVGGDGASEIGTALAKRVREGSLPPAEEQKLNQNLAAYAKTNDFKPDELQGMVSAFEKNVRDTDKKNLEGATSIENNLAAMTRNGGNFYLQAPTLADDNVIVAKHGPEDAERFKAMGWEDGDFPSRTPPFTAAQSDFLYSLHESEHAMNKPGRSPVMPEGYDPKLAEQAGEIDADTAVIKFLNDTDDKAGKEYWLQKRNVNSFSDGIQGEFGHDTATFLRVQEQTGQQIDLGKYRQEKEGLMNLVKEKFNPVAVQFGTIKNGQIMSAVGDILKDDSEHPEKKLLTPLQRAEAQQYLDDARAVGFTPNPDYPKPTPQQPAPAPVLQQNGPKLGA